MTAAPVHAVSSAKSAKKVTLAEKKRAVLAAPPDLLRKFGSHVIIGYHRSRQLTPLLKRGAIGGVFITRRNARRRSRKRLAREFERFRELATDKALRPLWIATDQEGGLVAHLSPPLRRQKSLGRMLRRAKTAEEREEITRKFSETQAVGLSELGVNLNFAPVVDLKPAKRLRRDRRTHLIRRAISDDPDLIIEAAETYCNALASWRVLCTLKHFPGLQGVKADTHIRQASLDKSREELEAADWIPFWSLTATTPAAMMIGHAKLEAVDKDNPASASNSVISKLLREEWGYDGLIITDDLDMGAINRRPGGIGKASVDALQAGVDIILLTADGDLVYHVLYAMLKAHERGEFDETVLAQSRKRLDRYAERFSPRTQTWPEDMPVPTPAPHRSARAD
jgi:beta-N-acetylhexosaminidase